MNFAYAHFLWLLLIIPPLLLLFFWWAGRERQRLMTQFIQARLLPGLTSGLSPARRKVRLTLILLAVVMLIVALARPQWGFTWEEARQKGLDIVVAIDTSKSMLAEDIAPNRLQRAKLAALDLMQQAKSDRLGLVAFAGSAFLQCPLTIDDNAFRQSVESLDVNIIPQGGTALAAAINTALTAFKEGNNFKVLVLLTDGEDNDENALQAAQAAAKEGMRIFTIGIGTANGELLRIKDAKGRTDYIRDEQGNVVKSRLNEALLQQIAGATPGGFYLPLRGAKTIDTLYEKGLAPLPKSEGQEKLIKHFHERYHWPLALAILLLLGESLLPEQRRRRERNLSNPAQAGLPAEPPPTHRTPVTTAAISLIVGLSLWPCSSPASPASALKDYEAGKYSQALQEYEQAIARRKDDARLHYNAGTAAFRDGKFDEAARYFTNALPAQDLKLQEHAYYNLGNSLYRAGEAATDQKQMQELWEGAEQQYGSALKLNTNNADARFNYQFVKQKLAQLKQQQQQQQNQNKDQKDKQDQKQQQQNQKNGQQQDQKSGQQKQEQQKDQSSQPQSAKSDQQKQDEQQAANDSQKQEQPKQAEQQQAKSAGDESKDKKDAGEPIAVHQMTPQEAKQMLDAQKGEEQVLLFQPQDEPKSKVKPLKDW